MNCLGPKRTLAYGGFLILTACALVMTGKVDAATFCVSSASELRATLEATEINGEDDAVEIVQGTYKGSFVYSSNEAYGLAVEGGYTAGCGSKALFPEKTVLDGDHGGPVLVLNSSMGVAFQVHNLTLRNGQTTSNANGGGLYLYTDEGDVSVSNCIVDNNSAAGSGGGAYVYNSNSASFTDSVFSNNASDQHGTSNDYGGGGVYAGRCGTVSFVNNTFEKNTTTKNGGGASVANGDEVIFSDNTISDNITTNLGGGVYIGKVDTIFFTGNTVDHNTSKYFGAGIYTTTSDTAAFTGNVITNNTLSGAAIDKRAGGAYLYQSGAVSLINNIICGNLGSGLLVRRPKSLTLTNNTVSDNNADLGEGGGIWVELYSESDAAHIYNNIIWGNSAAVGADMWIDNDGDNDYFYSPVNLFNNDFDQSEEAFWIADPDFHTVIDSSNLDNLDPLFADSPNGDYMLREGSPAINVGNNSAPQLPPTDIDGKPRILDDSVDLGAYEFKPIVYLYRYVSPDGSCDGNTPCYSLVQSAVNDPPVPADGVPVIMAEEGTYEDDGVTCAEGLVYFRFGWDEAYDEISSQSDIRGALTITGGTVRMDRGLVGIAD